MYTAKNMPITERTIHFFRNLRKRKIRGSKKSGCIKNASLKCPVKNKRYARVIPQAAHGMPNMRYIGQEKIFSICFTANIIHHFPHYSKKKRAKRSLLSCKNFSVLRLHVCQKFIKRNGNFHKTALIIGKLVRRIEKDKIFTVNIKALILQNFRLCP